MTPMSPFDHRPDPQVGGALRDVLQATDDAAFTRRVVAAAETILGGEHSPEWWEVLVRWARPELAAASLALLAGMALWFGVLGGNGEGQLFLGDPLRAADERLAVPALLATSSAPNMDEVLAVALGN